MWWHSAEDCFGGERKSQKSALRTWVGGGWWGMGGGSIHWYLLPGLVWRGKGFFFFLPLTALHSVKNSGARLEVKNIRNVRNAGRVQRPT